MEALCQVLWVGAKAIFWFGKKDWVGFLVWWWCCFFFVFRVGGVGVRVLGFRWAFVLVGKKVGLVDWFFCGGVGGVSLWGEGGEVWVGGFGGGQGGCF